MGYVIDIMADICKNTFFLVRQKKIVYCFVAGELLLLFNSVIDV